MKGDLISFAKKRKTRVGIAHTDLFGFCASRGLDPQAYLTSLAENGIFWEMNVNYDSIHHYREHAYVKEFQTNENQQAIVRESGVRLSVGFDGHRVEDYLPERIASYCKKIEDMGIRLVFDND
jgi:histidinol phosphatase-like PHP family hydrolase